MRTHQTRASGSAGFTLIEVLVVVAIIALLISILLPSLQAARVQTRLVVCQANLKQVAMSASNYQTEYAGYVPVMFNTATVNATKLNNPGLSNAAEAPARTCWVSVALAKYAAQTRNLGSRTVNGTTYDFNPERMWEKDTTRIAYFNYVMPEFYACPFQRGKGPYNQQIAYKSPYVYYDDTGRFDTIQTLLTEFAANQLPASGMPWPGAAAGSRDGIPKYAALSWNCVPPDGTFSDGTPITPVVSNKPAWYKELKNMYRRWTPADAKRLRSTMSTSTVAFCSQGEHVLGANKPYVGWANKGSHSRNGTGGSNVIFADTHVEWVTGKQVGWP